MSRNIQCLVAAFALSCAMHAAPVRADDDDGSGQAAAIESTAEGEVAPVVAPAKKAPAAVEKKALKPSVELRKAPAAKPPQPAPVVQRPQPAPAPQPTQLAPAIKTLSKPPAPVQVAHVEKAEADMARMPEVVAILQRQQMDLAAAKTELAEAKKEVTRLRDLVTRIAEANKREQTAMHYNLGCAYKVAGEPRKAEAELLESLKLDPHDAATHYNLGILYDDDLKDKKKAKEHYEMYLRLAPNSKDAPIVMEWVKTLRPESNQ